MNLTLLLDLDDTLLVNDIDAFIPAYLQALSKALAGYTEPNKMVEKLLAATGKMVRNQRPDRTLEETFAAAFYPALGIPIEELRPPIERFYADDFPSLQRLTSPRSETLRLVEQALERGWRLVIATNPLFPRTAIEQRLAWAGLPVDQYPFALVTSYETFHFAKPNPAYFAEVLARLAWPGGPVVMVGNDLENDIAPSRRLGLAAYWVGGQPGTEGVMTGGLEGLVPWLDSAPPETLLPENSRPETWLHILRSTPAYFDSHCRDLLDQAWQRSQPGEWNLTEILCHLRDVEIEVNLPRVKTVLAEDNPFIPGKDTDPWAKERQYFCQNGPQALQSFTATRLELLELLGNQAPADWQRHARHAILGPTTLGELVSIVAAHDRLHVQQAEAT